MYSKIRKETFDFIYNHFKIEKIDKNECVNVTKSFDEVFTSYLDSDITFDKFKYILGKKPNKNLKIKDYKFNFDAFVKEINVDFLDTGVNKNFEEQICNLAFVYGFDELEMVGLYQDSINKSGLYDYRLLKNKANQLFIYKRNMKAPKLVHKDEVAVENQELISYLENTPSAVLLEDVIPNYPERYLKTIEEVYANIELPRGVLNCMILKVIRDKGGELPTLNYFKKMSQSWITDNIFSTQDAIKYVTTLNDKNIPQKKASTIKGWDEI